MYLINGTHNSILADKNEFDYVNHNLSSILNCELESIISVLGPDERIVLLKKILEVALTDLNSTVEKAGGGAEMQGILLQNLHE
jgi:hypothetical protein